jgi:hypothetical protein
MLNVIMLNVTYAECHIKAPYAECHYAERRYAECRGAKGGALRFICTCVFGGTVNSKNANDNKPI